LAAVQTFPRLLLHPHEGPQLVNLNLVGRNVPESVQVGAALFARVNHRVEPIPKAEPLSIGKAEPLGPFRGAQMARRAPLAQLTRSSKRGVSADQVCGLTQLDAALLMRSFAVGEPVASGWDHRRRRFVDG